MRTGELAARARVNVQTLRYYERRGLLPEPTRTGAGYRVYSPEAVRVVRFVKRSQALGFSLDDVEELLHLAGGGPDSCDQVRAMSAEKIGDLDRRIAELTAMRDALADLVRTCGRPPAERVCPILAGLDDAS